MWLLSRICEERLAPDLVTAAHQPIGLVLEVLEARAYARAKQAVESAKKAGDVDGNDPMVQWVMQLQAERAMELRGITFGRKPKVEQG